MASSVYKTFLNNDIITSSTLLHEAIPIPGTLVDGSHYSSGGALGTEQNVKLYSHEMFVSLYDYPHASSSANHIMDITCGVSPYIPVGANGGLQGGYEAGEENSLIEAMEAEVQSAVLKKRNIYVQMSALLNGHTTNQQTGQKVIRLFDKDGNYDTEGDKIIDPIFLTFSRLLVKDEIKKGSFVLELGVAESFSNPSTETLIIVDEGAQNNYRINSPVGEFGILKVKESSPTPTNAVDDAKEGTTVGLIYYQAGIVVLDGSAIFHQTSQPDAADMEDMDGVLNAITPFFCPDHTAFHEDAAANPANKQYREVFVEQSIETMAHNIRKRIIRISFNNTVELNSAIYFCRANAKEFNYSSNPTYLDQAKIRVKKTATDAPRSYITTVGLYSAKNELLAVAKLSEPLRKDPTNEFTLRVRLDY